MSVEPANVRPKWSGLIAKGKQVKLLGDFQKDLVIASYETEEQADRIVAELRRWSRGQREDEEFRSLCRS